MKAACASVLLLVLCGCTESEARQSGSPIEDDPLMVAIMDAMCATSREDLASALGNVADTAGSLPDDERKSISELAWGITPEDCQRHAEKLSTPAQ